MAGIEYSKSEQLSDFATPEQAPRSKVPLHLETAVFENLEQSQNEPATPLRDLHRKWLRNIVDEASIDRIDNLSVLQRQVFAVRLANMYQSIEIPKINAVEKRVRAEHIVDFVTGSGYKEIGDQIGVSKNNIYDRISRISRTIGSQVKPEDVVSLVPNSHVATLPELITAEEAIKVQAEKVGKAALRQTKDNFQDEGFKARQNWLGEHEPATDEKTKKLTQVALGTGESAYRARLLDHPILTASQEVELAKRIEKGDLAAKDKLITHNTKLVAKIAKGYSYHPNFLSFDDVFQEGVLGLTRAAEKFDYRMGFKFSTYASWWIKQAVQRAVQDKETIVRLPNNLHDRAREIRNLETQYQREHSGEQMNIEEISSQTGLPVQKIMLIKNTLATTASLDMPISEEESATFGSMQPNNDLPVEDIVIEEDLISSAMQHIDSLGEQSSRALRMHIGLNARKADYAQIGAELGVSANAARSIVTQSLKDLREKITPSTKLYGQLKTS